MKTTLLVMAAGMGSRFGGLKQIVPVGPNGETIMDYSVFDAKRAGFDKAVFIIKREFEKEFREIAAKRIEKTIDVDYAFQSTDNMPEGRNKPWGTGHAILCSRELVNTPFCVINADDYYGSSAYKVMHDHLQTSGEYSMVGYLLENTVTENGTVTRGVCEVENGYLNSVTEHMSIAKSNSFPKETIVSMNFWGFLPNLFDYLDEQFTEFLDKSGDDLKSEFLIPRVVDSLIRSGKERVKVLTSTENWYGVTYREDLEGIRKAIAEMVAAGKYDGMGR